jgi:uncharacterized repeat protein (TIGR02543 family)
MEELQNESPAEENLPKFRGLYRHVKIPVKALDFIIVACIAVILIVFVMELRNPGFTVTFDSKGGTDVATQISVQHGQLLERPEPPTREGYTFTGWYKDPACDMQWNMETDTIESDITLYAGWQKNE